MSMRDRFLLPLCAALAVAACARPQRAQDAYAAAVAEAIPVVERTTGLTYRKPPVYKVRTRAEIHDFLEKLFNEEKPARDLAEQQAILRRLGVIPDTLDLRRLELDLLTEQIVGL